MINEKTLKMFLPSLSNEQLGKVIREFIKPSNISLNEIEMILLTSLKEKQNNYSKGALKGWQTKRQNASKNTWQKIKEQKEDLSKRDLQQKQYNKFSYNYKQDEHIIKPVKIDKLPFDDELI